MITDRIKRWWQGHGFGIESKTDYAFLHDILKEDTPYYAYEEWTELFPDATAYETRLAKLTLRLSNCIQPTKVHVYGHMVPIINKAITNGCGKTSTQQHTDSFVRLQSLNIRARIEQGSAIEMLPHDMSGANDCAAVLLSHIDTHNASLWQEIVRLPVITYDMRHTGIAIMRRGRYPEHYKI